jgi:hypothetical protein
MGCFRSKVPMVFPARSSEVHFLKSSAGSLASHDGPDRQLRNAQNEHSQFDSEFRFRRVVRVSKFGFVLVIDAGADKSARRTRTENTM